VTAAMYLLGIVLFVVGLALSVGLHEMGHMVPAKRFGVKVTQFFIGFGNTVWSFRRGETEYGVKSVPLGGYVKLVGMLPPGKGGRPTGPFGRLISDARNAEYELVGEGDDDRLFYRLPWWKKVIVMAGGPTVNIVLAFLFIGSVFMLHGTAEPRTTISEVSRCVVPATLAQGAEPACRAGDPETPAMRAGLRPGDRIVALNDTRITSWDQAQKVIRDNRDGDLTISYERDGRLRTATTTTVINSVSSSPEDPDKVVKVGFLGVSPVQVVERQSPAYVAGFMVDSTWRSVQALASLPNKLWHVALATAGVEQRDPTGPQSVVGAGRMSGHVIADDAVPVSDRLWDVLLILGGVNLFLGVFNFLPLLPLDGGHIAGALYEAVRRWLARLFHRPDPGYFDVARLLPVAYMMAGVILVMSLVLIVGDIVAPVPLG
jgi:membrane-associated protease RseP (regulator of RpoE activity)